MANGDPLYHISRRIDDVGDQLQILDGKFETHRTHIDNKFLEMHEAIIGLTASEKAVEKHTDARHRRNELRIALVSMVALVCSIGIPTIALAAH